MQAHNNTGWLIFKIVLLLSGIPLGAICCALLLRRTRNETDSDRKQYQRLGLFATGYAFVQQLMVLAVNFLPQRLQTWSIIGWLPILALTGILAAGTGAVLTVVNGRGMGRYGGFLLSLLAIAYSALTILAFVAGGGGL
jgi:hypothetical protein